MADEELKPCPFCGRQPVLEQDEFVKTYWKIYCSNVDCVAFYARGFFGKQSAVKAWNRRQS